MTGSQFSYIGDVITKCFSCASKGQRERSLNNNRERPWEIYTLKELLHATNNFHYDNEICKDGPECLYWGRKSKGIEIAVKRLKEMNPKAAMEFAAQVEIRGRVRHKNLIGFRGFYAGGVERLLVYDCMPNHSLMSHLNGHLAADILLDWPRRMGIATGTAEGLAYLHHEANPLIIHKDINASNVLLDSEFEPKVAGFSFAMLIPEGITHLTTRVKGTPGHVAPEYAMWGRVSKSNDVYSFGILVLEIISARKPIEMLAALAKLDIEQWATPSFVQQEAFDHIVNSRLKGKFDWVQLKSVATLAMRCTEIDPENRPSMMEVVEWLKVV